MPNPDPSLNERLAEKLGWRRSGRSGWMRPETPEGYVNLHSPPDYLTYPGMGVVLEAMRGRGRHSREFDAFCTALCELSDAPQSEYRGDEVIWRLTPELVAEAALLALEGEADGG